MRTSIALLLAAVFAMYPFGGVAGEKKIADIKELAGSWRGWVTGELGQERANMIVQANGSYKASTTQGSTSEGQFYLQDGKLRYRNRFGDSPGVEGVCSPCLRESFVKILSPFSSRYTATTTMPSSRAPGRS